MKTTNLLALPLLLAALAGCSALHWSGQPQQVAGVTTGVRPDPARPVPREMEIKPFINNLPRTFEEYTKAAGLYLDLAGKYRREAASHEAMKKLYGDTDPAMAEHCENLSRQLSALADQCEAIGKEHEKKAEALKKLER